MTERDIVTEEKKPKKMFSLLAEAWSDTPELAHTSLKLALIIFVVTVVLSFTCVFIARLLNEIPVTILYAYTIALGIAGTVVSSLSVKEHRTFFGIVSLLICLIATLWNSYVSFIIQCDAWFSFPP